MKSLKITAFVLLIMVVASVSAFSQWEWAGGLYLSNFSAVGSAGTGIFVNSGWSGESINVSTDGGRSWKTTNLGGWPTNFLELHAYADTAVIAIRGGTILASHDHGLMWTQSDSGINHPIVTSLAYSRGASSPAHGIAMAATSAGVYVSSDFGAHWSLGDSGLTSLALSSVIAVDSVFLVATADKGIFKSTNNGLTWLRAMNGLADSSVTVLATIARQAYAATGTKVYRSSNAGTSWTAIPADVPAAIINLILVPTPGKGNDVAIFALTGGGTYRLSYLESTWTGVRPAPGPNPTLAGHTFMAADTVLYAVTFSSIERSIDLGDSWAPLRKVDDASFLVRGHRSSRYAHPSMYSGTFVTNNFGSNWVGLRSVSSGFKTTAFAVSEDTSATGYDRLTVGSDSGRVEFSNNGGQTWKVVRNPDSIITIHQVGYDMRVQHQCMAVEEMNGIVYTSVQVDKFTQLAGDPVAGVYKTTNLGATWDKIHTTGLTDSLILTLKAFRGKSGEKVLLAAGWATLFRSTNDGASWSSDTVHSIAAGKRFIRRVNQTLFLCTQGSVATKYLSDGSMVQTFDSCRVYRSTDDGISWLDVTGDLHVSFVRGFAAVAMPQYTSRVLLAVCTDGKVLTSTEGGKQWTEFGTGLPYFSFGDEVEADNEYVYAGISGVRRRPLTDAVLTSTEELSSPQPTSFVLSQNYPNPFNPTTTITYELPKVSSVRLTVYDILGREVQTLVNEIKQPGRYQVQFNGNSLASGVYLYRLQAGSFVQTRRFVLLK